MAVIVVILILFCDQLIKYLVKTSMTLHESIHLAGDWAQLFFTENKGMAFGMDFMGTFVLTLLRIVAVAFLVYFIHQMIKRRCSTGFLICMAMVLAGAAGNIIDNIFYGLIYTESTDFQVSSLVQFGQGYGGLFEGKVVDMFYFPIIRTTWPDWIPIWGGENFVFFSPIFNFADAAITTGAFLIIFCYPRTFSRLLKEMEQDSKKTPEKKDKA
jgi:signal peptidase II